MTEKAQQNVPPGTIHPPIKPVNTGLQVSTGTATFDVFWYGGIAGSLNPNISLPSPNLEIAGDAVVGSVPPGGNLQVNGDHTVTGAIHCGGSVNVKGDVILQGADCAEQFDIVSRGQHGVEAGTVMVINHEGVLEPSSCSCDKRVAGVISGAGAYRPGIVLDKQDSGGNRMPVALVGKVYCKVDAAHAPIQVGDLLTTSSTPGHAMKATEPLRAFGAVIGKALRPLAAGQGLIPILISLQ